jgi:Nucleotidyl transferase AbiEii toxin, Type IV TA system
MVEYAPELALAAIRDELARRGRRFALVGGLAVSVRAEVRFTRDVDLVVLVTNDSEAEALIYELRSVGYSAVASVEHETQRRLSTIRLMSPSMVKVDLLFASSGIEREIVDGATPIDLGSAGTVPVASAEELLAMKILSMTDTRLQDRIDAQRLLQFTPTLDISRVREHLARITSRGYARDQDLQGKLAVVLRDVGREVAHLP